MMFNTPGVDPTHSSFQPNLFLKMLSLLSTVTTTSKAHLYTQLLKTIDLNNVSIKFKYKDSLYTFLKNIEALNRVGIVILSVKNSRPKK